MPTTVSKMRYTDLARVPPCARHLHLLQQRVMLLNIMMLAAEQNILCVLYLLFMAYLEAVLCICLI